MLAGCPTWPEEFAARYRQEGCWQGETFGTMLRRRAAQYGDRIAIVSGDRRVSYAELDEQADRLAAGFYRLGIRAQDRVIVQLPNIPQFFEVIFALFRIGALPVFSLPVHRKNEIGYLCEFTQAAAYVIPDKDAGFDYRELAAQVKDTLPDARRIIVAGEPGEYTALNDLYVEPSIGEIKGPSSGDVAFLQLSGGTTGLPKLIPRTHDDYIYSLRISAEVCALNEHSVYLAVLPIAHNYPLSSPGVLGTLYAGGRIVLARGASPDEAFPLIAKERVTIAAVVPPIALIWMDAAESRRCDISHLQVLQVGGAKFSAEAAKRVRTTIGCTLQQVYGMAEGLVNYTRFDDPEETIINTQGRPMSPYDEIRIVDDEDDEVAPGEVGHLLTRGPYTIRGYYKAEQHNARSFTSDGFYRTGDMARMTPAGYLVIEGRAKDQINRGGDKVAAEEIENHLLAHPGVHDAAVVSMPDEFLGERTCAFVIRYEAAITGSELKAFLRDRGLASYKIPDRVEFVESFPQTGVGKVSKKMLRELIAAKQEAALSKK
ncbi:(2,3-dihydroxybenzoyl)adenylate synthase [Paenibacillus alvei]|uniref:(2,3-dihydroxybenzoyl)adenylate synthase n=1 Tax=Paenibacillus alvei TaxID=44250 RepID=A0ABT4GTK2_PAEAL|nr:(2,3-dihydroxybenzoyl)adenylate synthase [Paenibacillus alvei]EJW17845.1 2,3-dihydroxybenzoate-AMP ligase [Paenibacillus alvei DSM 29]MCY7483273.1 (2,3-dihydroxybenzoyl)adenylate synthase [Paenibacillus alvei]MCY9543359.1 (2,3-dihydroxybenzoyl)adenylate synthase [Paenibacillus alvei]MCY9706688.1 (2,3-dihydroxybenzoyl)adenylate synthase [Paenibacillus alvei]MCY9736437.1 (2,3-dihydroxybenzoyl)adenylate synthase [Paenibacillus alvei]